MEKILRTIERFVPRRIYKLGQPAYHYSLALLGALLYRFPSRKLKIIGVTGTKGKSSTVELINTVLETAGYKTAIISTVRFKIDKENKPNLLKMTMPGRFMLQQLLHDAVTAGCTYAIVEMSSEGTRFFRHKFIDIDTLIFTNLAPEHIESHGSYENYRAAKLKLAHALSRSSKRPRTLIVNGDDKESPLFLKVDVENKKQFYLADAKPYQLTEVGTTFTYQGETIETTMPGTFSIYNMLAAANVGTAEGVSPSNIKQAFEQFTGVPGRAERVYGKNKVKQNFTVIVDYAHTADSLEAIYQAFPEKRKICVLGGTGGGRDTWKRPLMGEIAGQHCDTIYLTNEDPYDEDPDKIIAEVAGGIKNKEYTIIMDRREAIRTALENAKENDVVLITGKGTDPYIMGPRGTKTPWSDARITSEELDRVLG